MQTNPLSSLSDAALREMLLLLEQGISPGRLRPESINVARALLGSQPDSEGVFGNIPLKWRRSAAEGLAPSHAQVVVDNAQEWIDRVNLSNHPVGLTLGCFPSGIEAGCRKHLECPSHLEMRCPFRDGEPGAAELNDLLDQHEKDDTVDIMPALRRCQFLGCVRPERAKAWLKKQQEQNRLPALTDTGPTELPTVQELADLLGFGDVKAHACGTGKKHGCLDSLCPHFDRTWKEQDPERENELVVKSGLNQHRFLQCSVSRPWPSYGHDPARPTTQYLDPTSALPKQFGDAPPGLFALPEPRGFTELPALWLRQAGFSGAGVVVVDEAEKSEGIYYLQMGSSVPLLRDYYEMPYFWLGEELGAPWPDVVKEQLIRGRPQYIQCLFRGHRQAAADPADWKPELLDIFRDGSSRWLAPFGRGRFLYCPDGEISFFLLFLRLLRLLSAHAGGGKPEFFARLLEQFEKIAVAEIWTGATGNSARPELPRIFNELLNLRDDGEPLSLREELINLGLLSVEPGVASGSAQVRATPRLRSLAAWLLHFREACDVNAPNNQFIPTEFLATTTTAASLSFRDIVSRVYEPMAFSPPHLQPRCISAVLDQLDDIEPVELEQALNGDVASIGLRGIVAAIVSVVAENLEEGADHWADLERMILQIVRRGRFPLAGYYAWRTSGTRDFCLGHFGVPIGQGNPVTSREDAASMPWREDQFFLAGIDECLLAGGESQRLFDRNSGAARKLAHGLANVALLGRVLFAPLADSTINYTIFQRRLLEAKQSEENAAKSRAHQQTTLISRFSETLKTPGALEAMPPEDRRAFLAGLRETIRAVVNENRIYLDVTTGFIGDKLTDDGRPDFTTFTVELFLADLASRYRRWAELTLYTDRMKPLDVASCAGTVQLPRSYLNSLLWELITNHQKYSRAGARITLTADLLDADHRGHPTVLEVSLRSPLPDLHPDFDARLMPQKRSYGIGQDFVQRTLRFMMSYERGHQTDPPAWQFEPQGADYVSVIRIDLARVAARFAVSAT